MIETRAARVGVGALVLLSTTAAFLPFAPRAAAQPPAVTLAFTAAPASAAPNTAFTTAPAVTVTGSTDAVTLSLVVALGEATGDLTCTALSVAPTSGVSTFAGCKISRGGKYKLRATLGAVQAESAAFVVSGPAWVEFTGQPSGGVGGTAWTGQPRARVVDGNGAVIASSTAKIGL